MQYKEFDIYVYRMFFLLRWGKEYFYRRHRYNEIKQTSGERFRLPPEVQAVILAARAMEFGEIT